MGLLVSKQNYAYQVTSHNSMSHVQFVSGILLVSAMQTIVK